jgi:hypothetical protein
MILIAGLINPSKYFSNDSGLDSLSRAKEVGIDFDSD